MAFDSHVVVFGFRWWHLLACFGFGFFAGMIVMLMISNTRYEDYKLLRSWLKNSDEKSDNETNTPAPENE